MLPPGRAHSYGAGRCLPPPLVAAHALLATVDAAIAAVAFVQLLRNHLRNQRVGWTRQKVFHAMIGVSNIGFFVYFVISIFATCEGWPCWSHGCGFILMAFPQILFLAAFLLLLSFWVDLCHQTNDEEEDDDDNGYAESLLESSKAKPGLLHAEGRRRCCSFRNIHIGSRQKFVILVITLTFISAIAFSLLIWLGRGNNPIDSLLVARVYLAIFSVAILLLGGALACYGLLLFTKLRKVRSEMVSTEIWKVSSLAAVSFVCFTSCAVLALVTNIPLQVHCYWNLDRLHSTNSSVFSFLYYFVGSSVPSVVVLWVMREMPPRLAADRPAESRAATFIRDSTTSTHNPQWRSVVTSSQTKALKSSPI